MYTAKYFNESFIAECLEGFLYGFYSGIFILFLQCPSKQSRTAIILFYAVCVLYVLSTFVIIGDCLNFVRETHLSKIPPQTLNDSKSKLIRFMVAQTTVNGCCDFIAQCIIIYRCWIVWSQNIYVVIIPSFLAIVYLATWLAPFGSLLFVHGQFMITSWGVTLTVTSLAISVSVNALMTGLIVFKISKVFLEVEATSTSIDRTLGITRNNKLRHIVFVVIESGMALFAIQVVRVVLTSLPISAAPVNNGLNFVVVIHRMFNGITPTIILVRVSMKSSFDDTESFKETAESLCFQSDPNTSENGR